MNASNLKYRNRLKRRVMITRQQLYQPAPLQEPLSPADVVPRQVDRNNNDNRGGHVMKQRSINNNTNNNSGVRKEERDNENHDGYVSRHNGSSNINNNRVANHDSHRTSRPPNNNSVNQKGSNEGEAMVNRAREIISQRSQRINSSASSPSSPKASLSRASAGSGNENHSNLDNSQKSTPTRRNSIRKNTVGSMVNRYESRGGAATQQIMANPHKEQPQPQQRWPQQTYTRKSPPASKSTYTPPTATTTTATTNHTQYKLAPPQGGHDDMSTTAISVLTDEAMEDRNSMIRNVINWERRMQLKRQQSKQQQQNQQHRQQPLQQSKGDCMKRSSEEEEGDIVNLVHEAIAINAGMMTKKSPIRSAKPTRTTANAAAVTTMSSTPKHQSTLKPVVTPEDNQHMTKNDNSTTTNNNVNNPPPPPPPSSSLDEKELPPSPAPTDHSADAAAGMMFALHGKSSTRKKVGSVIKNNEEQESKEEMIRNNESRPSGGTTNTVKVDGRAITSPPPRIISPSSDGVNKPPSSTSTTKTLTSTSTPPRHHHHHNQLNLEQKLGRLATHQTTTPPPRNTNPSSVLSASKVSVVSIQPSIESECVRQNAEILVAMEDAMMDFLGGGGVVGAQAVNGNGDVDEDEGGVTNDDRLNEAFSNSKYVLPEEEEVEGDKIGVRGFNAGGIHNQMVGDTFSTLYSLDERDESDEFADPPLISSDSNSDSNSRRSDASSSRSGSMSDEHNDSGEFIIAKQRKKDKNLGTFLDQLGSLLGVGCALDRDEDSDIFYMNNSQFNTSLVSADVEEMMMNQRRIEGGGVKKAEKDDTRKKRVPALHSSESFCGESHTTMPRGNTAQRRDQLAYLSPTRESGPAFQFARHDISSDDHQPDPDLSLEVDDDDDDNDADDESDCLPDPEEANDADDCGSGRDPPRGIDPDEGEDVFHRNRFQKQNPLNTTSAALTLDNVKMSQREKHKGSSLHWQSSNGLILDDETNAKQLSSIRAKASEKIESTSKLPSTNATLLQEHFVESEHKLSPNYRRRGGGQLQFIDEVEEEDASAPSVEEESEGPQYDYEQFIEDFRDVVQKDSATYEPEPVEELVIGSISETSSLKDEEVDLRINAKHQNVTQRREIEAAVHRSMRQSSYSRQQRNVHHDPKPKLVKPQFEGRQQERHTAQSSDQPGNRAAVTQHSRQAAYGRQYTHPQPVPQPKAATTRLEEKLRGLGAPKKLFGDSVGTSELGSLYSAVGVPKTIYQRTNPPPSKMQNTSNQGPRQRALNIPSRGPTPGLSSQLPLHGRVSPQPGQKTADGFVDSKNTLGFIPIGSETWKLKHEFLDSSPLDPPPRSSPLGFFPTSIDEASQISDGFGSLKNNALGSLKVGAETWNLKYDFNDSPASRNDPFHPPQPQKVESRQHSEPVAPPNVNRFRERTFPSGSPKNDSSNRHPPKKLVMKSITEIRDGTRVQTLRFVGREDSPSPQQPLSPSTGLPSGKKLFQSFPSAVKVARSASSPQSQRVSRVVKKSDQPSQGQMLQTEKRRRNQGAHIGSRQTANNPTPTRPMTNRSLEDNLRRIDPPSSETPTFTEAETSQVSGSVFEAVEVGSFGVQHTLFSKWDKPKDTNHHSVQPHPYQSHPPQRQASGMHHGRSAVHQSSVSYVSTFNGRQAPDQVVAKLDSLRLKGRFKRRK